MAEPSGDRLVLVHARWCPHCVPISTDAAPRLAAALGVPLTLLDIDRPAEELQADDLVRRYGDWTEDYLIPQVFLDRGSGRVTHLLTGVPGSLTGTEEAWKRLLDRGQDLLADSEAPG
jgi:glutaredoxin